MSIPWRGARRAEFEAMLRRRGDPIALSSGVLAPAALPSRSMPEFQPFDPCHQEPCRRGGLFDYRGEELELELLLRSGFTGEFLPRFDRGDPVLRAIVLRRGAEEWRSQDVDLIVFLCTWGAPGVYSVHVHGLPSLGCTNGLEHRQSHCSWYDRGYYLRLFDPQLLQWPS
jgi:hypothetical protein